MSLIKYKIGTKVVLNNEDEIFEEIQSFQFSRYGYTPPLIRKELSESLINFYNTHGYFTITDYDFPNSYYVNNTSYYLFSEEFTISKHQRNNKNFKFIGGALKNGV